MIRARSVGAYALACIPPRLRSRTRLPPRNPDQAHVHDEGTTLTLEELQKRHIQRVLDDAKGRVEIAARRLGIPRSTLYQRLKAMQIHTTRSGPDGEGAQR